MWLMSADWCKWMLASKWYELIVGLTNCVIVPRLVTKPNSAVGMCVAARRAEGTKAAEKMLRPGVQTRTSFTTFPVESALHRSIHRPEGDLGKRHFTLEIQWFWSYLGFDEVAWK